MIRCCKHCTSRYPACHDSCKEYQEEKKAYEQERAEQRLSNMADSVGMTRQARRRKIWQWTTKR